MKNFLINSDKFYILSGLSASGKSTFTKQLIEQGLPEDAIVSTDTLRRQILGFYPSLDEYGVRENLHGWDTNQSEIFNIINSILEIRFKQRLTTVLDATNLNDDIREPFVKLAQNYGMSSEIIIFDTPNVDLKSRLANRKERFDYRSVERQMTSFANTSKFSHLVVTPEDKFTFVPNLIDTEKLDIIGDTHGLLDETITLVNKKGWTFSEDKFTHTDKDRKILFLGDVVDRGTQSIELITAVMNTVQQGQGYFVLGNHEAKLIATYEIYKNEGLVRGRSLSNAQTLMKLLNLEENKREDIYNFLLSSPAQISLWIDKKTGKAINGEDYKNKDIFKFAFAHADTDYYSPYNFTKSQALYGKRKTDKTKDYDSEYDKHYKHGLNEHIYFRGHIPNYSKCDYVYSLEEDQAFRGNLVLLDLENYIQDLKNNNWISKHKLFEENIMKQKSEFHFDESVKTSVDLMKKMNQMVKEGLATDGWRKDESGVKVANPDGIRIYKYSKKVHFKRLWKTEPLLEKARGLAIDITGNIVVHPFDKLYNYGEYDVGSTIKSDHKVQVIDKLNGFLGCISPHPFRKELLISTTGSLSSDFVDYIKSFIDSKTEATLLNYFKDNKQTLMFEVIHPEDKHIIEYDQKDNGLWLIGARGLNLTDKILTEEQLDKLGVKLNFRRPQWTETTFGEVLEKLPSSELEGYMIRDAETQQPLMKIKTNYYLVTKFLGRMGLKMSSMMYKRPEQFKEHHVEEEFYPIVDKIVSNIPQEKFETMTQGERTEFVRSIVDEVRQEVNKPRTLKL